MKFISVVLGGLFYLNASALCSEEQLTTSIFLGEDTKHIINFDQHRFKNISFIKHQNNVFNFTLNNTGELVIVTGKSAPDIANKLKDALRDGIEESPVDFAVSLVDEIKFNIPEKAKSYINDEYLAIGWKSEIRERCFERVLKPISDIYVYIQLSYGCAEFKGFQKTMYSKINVYDNKIFLSL